MRILDFALDRASRGRYHFTSEEARQALGVSEAALRSSLRRLRRRRLVASPVRGFHILLPPEYRSLGCLPAEQFVPDLMEHLGEPYYAALLTAAQYHGAAHQRPQWFQVMVPRARRRLLCGGVGVTFVVRKDLEAMPTLELRTPRGRLRVATPEVTALELVGYARRLGGLDAVATVLAELHEVLRPAELARLGALCPVSWVRRLGFLLERVRREDLAGSLEPLVREGSGDVTPLVRSIPRSGAQRSRRWCLALNQDLEPDL